MDNLNHFPNENSIEDIYLFNFCKYYKLSPIISILYLKRYRGDVILENDNNKKVSREQQRVEKQNGEMKTFISEVQEFNTPEDYDGAFKEYYPEQS